MIDREDILDVVSEIKEMTGYTLVELRDKLKSGYKLTNVDQVGWLWIDCKERLPEKAGRYIVDNGLWIGEGEFLSEDGYGERWVNINKVKAWMSLPKPYQKESE